MLRELSTAALLVFSLSCASQSLPTSTPTVADARSFLQRVNAEMLELQTASSHAEWTAETDINEDTEATSARLNGQNAAETLRLVAESHRFDTVELPAEMRRQMMLLQVNAPAAPKDPKLLEEATTLAAQLTGMYGKGKYCPAGAGAGNGAGAGQASGEGCLGIDAISSRMAVSRDPEELKRLWVGWHAIAPPMRAKYAREVELENVGARELGYKDTGELWRAGYDMSPAQFSAEMERAWGQLQPLYAELQAYVRTRLVAKYGAAAKREDGMIPAELLGNMWAQEWGNIYDVVAPTDPKLAQFKPVDLAGALQRQIAEKDPGAAVAFAKETDISSDKGHAAEVAAARQWCGMGRAFLCRWG